MYVVDADVITIDRVVPRPSRARSCLFAITGTKLTAVTPARRDLTAERAYVTAPVQVTAHT